jgi:Dolichyl-phosphate-mannose-protein mannosyltransferase
LITVSAPTDSTTRPTRTDSAARVLVVVVLVLVALLGVGLLGASLLPSGALAGRLLGTANSARAGTYTQDLVAYLGQRMRLAAALLLVLSVGLLVLRAPFQALLSSSFKDLRDVRASVRWPGITDVLALAVPTLLAIALRVAFLNQPMRYDEALTFNEFASRPLYYGLSFYPDPNNHLLNTLLVHFTSAALGPQPWVLRLPALLAGVLLVPATYALTRVLYGGRAAILSGLLVACSSYIVEYSTNSRGYTLQALCFVTLLCLAIAALRRDSPTALLLATLVAALGTYALPTMFYGVVIVAAWLAFEMRRANLARISRGQLVASGLLLGLVVTLTYLPVLLVSGADKLVSNRFVVPLDLAELSAELPVSLARTWGFWNRDLPLLVAALLLVGFVVATVADARQRRVPPGLLAPAVCLAIVLVQRVAPFERVWLFLLPLYFSIASGGLARLLEARRLPGYGFGSAVVGCGLAAVLGYTTLSSGSILASTETGTFPDAQAVTHTLSSVLASNDAVLTTLPASLPELQYYFARQGLQIDTLVRPPSEAHNLFVIAAPGASPTVDGWGKPHELQRFPGAVLLQLMALTP